MARKILKMGWTEVQKEMSIAGSPEKITQLGKDILALIQTSINTKNIAELINTQFALRRVLAELKLWEKMEVERQSTKP